MAANSDTIKLLKCPSRRCRGCQSVDVGQLVNPRGSKTSREHSRGSIIGSTRQLGCHAMMRLLLLKRTRTTHACLYVNNATRCNELTRYMQSMIKNYDSQWGSFAFIYPLLTGFMHGPNHSLREVGDANLKLQSTTRLIEANPREWNRS
ncbi:hypothetical protein VNO77_08039 [Canavalia gladiata]|uniref:Uncharacterized protein n=1 Tax=Canavalia gladiata TaxID=3824 RepID=A0AAN9MBX8_CANGL